MPLGFPGDLSFYKLLTDWGSILAGLLALVAGYLAYRAGGEQADATRKATDRQLKDQADAQTAEILNIKTAIRAEVIAFAKFVIGALENCQGIAAGTLTIPRSDANAIVRGLQKPTVFPAVADRIALLKNPHLPVQFYIRIDEAKDMANTLSFATVARLGAHGTETSNITVDRSNALAIADCLITALQLARAMIIDVPANMSKIEQFVTNQTGKDIDAAMAAARTSFPDASSFQAPG